MRNNNLDLFFRLVPIQEETQRQAIRTSVVNEQIVRDTAGNRQPVALGTPLSIETNYRDYVTQLMIPFAAHGIIVPNEGRDAFLNSLAIFIEHSDEIVIKTVADNEVMVIYDQGDPIGLEIEISKFSTFTIVEFQTPPAPPALSGPGLHVETIVINVETGNVDGAAVVSTETITRTTQLDGTKHDEVILTENGVTQSIKNVKLSGRSTARLVIPDENNEVVEINIRIYKQLANLYASERINLEIHTEYGRIIIPFDSLMDLPEDLYFRIVPIRESELQLEIADSVREEQATRTNVSGDNITINEIPYTIETNMPSRPVTIVLPLRATDLPSELEHVTNSHDNLYLYIEHSDGEKVIITGAIVLYDSNQIYGIQFELNKFSTFVILEMDAEIREYSLENQIEPAKIDALSSTIHVVVSEDEDVSNLIVKFILSAGATATIESIVQISEVSVNDFTSIVVYEIISSSGTVKVWTVYVTKTATLDPVDPSKIWHQAYMFGYPDNPFKPQNNITRAEMAVILSRVHGPTMQASSEKVSYPDLIETHWASMNISLATHGGLMQGYPDGKFAPNGAITRAEFTTIVARWLGFSNNTTTSNFADVKGHWAESYIAQITASGLMQDYPNGSFDPQKHLTRAEAVIVMNRLLNRGPLFGVEDPTWSDVPATHWAYPDIEGAS